MVVAFKNQRNLAGEVGGASLQEAEGGGVGVAAGLDRELEVVTGIVAGGVGGKAARRPMLKALVYRQNDHLACAGEPTMIEHARQVRPHTRTLAGIPA